MTLWMEQEQPPVELPVRPELTWTEQIPQEEGRELPVRQLVQERMFRVLSLLHKQELQWLGTSLRLSGQVRLFGLGIVASSWTPTVKNALQDGRYCGL